MSRQGPEDTDRAEFRVVRQSSGQARKEQESKVSYRPEAGNSIANQMRHGKELSDLLGQRHVAVMTAPGMGAEAIAAMNEFFRIVNQLNRQWLDFSSQKRTEARGVMTDEIMALFAKRISVYCTVLDDPKGDPELRLEFRRRAPKDELPFFPNQITDLGNRDREMKPYFTWWDGITWDDRDALVGAIDSATREADMQIFLEKRQHLLVQHLSSGHGRWVIPQKRLGAEYVTDFLLAARDSMGYSWTAVELESPLAKPFTQKGDLSSGLVHAIKQISDWRIWLKKNYDYASRCKDSSGLGLPDIDSDLDGLVIMGRRIDYPQRVAAYRRDLKRRLGVEVRPYEWLVDQIEARLTSLHIVRPLNLLLGVEADETLLQK